MSENLDLVRSIFAAWERGDYSSAEWADPAIEYSWVGGPAPGTWIGLEGMAEANRDVLSAWDDVSLQAKEYRELDDERVLVRFVQHGRGKSSGLDLAQVPSEAAHLFHLRNGKVRTLIVYWGADSALADLRLTPDTGT